MCERERERRGGREREREERWGGGKGGGGREEGQAHTDAHTHNHTHTQTKSFHDPLIIQGLCQEEKDRELFEAAGEGDLLKLIDLLLAGADHSSKHWGYSGEGWTPLHQAALCQARGVAGASRGLARRQYYEIVASLVAAGANVNASSLDGKKPLNWANGAVANLLREHGAETGRYERRGCSGGASAASLASAGAEAMDEPAAAGSDNPIGASGVSSWLRRIVPF